MEALIIAAAVTGTLYGLYLIRKANQKAALLKRVKDAQDAKRYARQYGQNGLANIHWSGALDRDGNPL